MVRCKYTLFLSVLICFSLHSPQTIFAEKNRKKEKLELTQSKYLDLDKFFDSIGGEITKKGGSIKEYFYKDISITVYNNLYNIVVNKEPSFKDYDLVNNFLVPKCPTTKQSISENTLVSLDFLKLNKETLNLSFKDENVYFVQENVSNNVIAQEPEVEPEIDNITVQKPESDSGNISNNDGYEVDDNNDEEPHDNENQNNIEPPTTPEESPLPETPPADTSNELNNNIYVSIPTKDFILSLGYEDEGWRYTIRNTGDYAEFVPIESYVEIGSNYIIIGYNGSLSSEAYSVLSYVLGGDQDAIDKAISCWDETNFGNYSVIASGGSIRINF